MRRVEIKFSEELRIPNDNPLERLFYKTYADDLVLIFRHEYLPVIIRIIKVIGDEFNLRLNPSKSNWIRIKGHRGRTYTLLDLGTVVDASGKVDIMR